MNVLMIKKLVGIDWYLNRLPLTLYVIVGLLALALLNVPSIAAFYVGTVLIVSVVIVVGSHLVFVTLVRERKSQTLAFVMSLPVSFMDYTMAKVITNMAGFLVPWLLLLFGTLMMIHTSDTIPNGLIPFSVILLLELFVAHVLVFTVTLVSESEVWAIVITTICNISVSLFCFFIANLAGISEHMQATHAVFNGTVAAVLAIELLCIISLITMAFIAQSRKKDFI
ncbi:MAG: hypothetical protein MJK04_31145 [Psychrosphaera sp.]|nr:hypothetical protein [Psychrosphaera sp.]